LELLFQHGAHLPGFAGLSADRFAAADQNRFAGCALQFGSVTYPLQGQITGRVVARIFRCMKITAAAEYDDGIGVGVGLV
jgi:hypothetical protein